MSSGAPDGALQVVRGGGRQGKHVLLGWQATPPHACAFSAQGTPSSASRKWSTCPFTLSNDRWSEFVKQSPHLISVRAKGHVPCNAPFPQLVGQQAKPKCAAKPQHLPPWSTCPSRVLRRQDTKQLGTVLLCSQSADFHHLKRGSV